MKKRFLALFLCCVMVFTLLPAALTTAFATGEADEETAPAQEIVDVEPEGTGDLDDTQPDPDGQPVDPDAEPVVCTCGAAADAAHAEDCPLYVNPEQPADDEKKPEDEQPVVCTCGAAEGAAHAEDCPLYVAPEQPAGDEQQPVCTCGAAEGAAHAEDCPLYVNPEQPDEDEKKPEDEQTDYTEVYEQLMAAETMEELDALLDSLADEAAADEFVAWLDANDKRTALEEHIAALNEQETLEQEEDTAILPMVVPFTNVGPLLPATVLRRANAPMAVTAANKDGNNGSNENSGLVLNKKAEPVAGGYKITMEAYATGQSSTTVSTTPADIVLVLDMSGFMDDCLVCGESDTATHQRYEAVYEVDTDKNYYIYNPSSYYNKYSEVEYCNGEHNYDWENHNAGWVQSNSYVYQHKSNILTPKTSVGDTTQGSVQFYTQITENCTPRINALKSAVSGFINNVGQLSPDSQIAIVKFAGTKTNTVGNNWYNSGWYNYSQIVKNLTAVDAAGKTALQEAVTALRAGGATRADYGMEHAQSIITNSGNNGHNKVVVMFTDGTPTSGSSFENKVANAAITASKDIKSKGATVYTIGVFAGADGTPVTSWNGVSNENKYMHLVSSNYKTATELTNPGTATYPEGGKSYYLSAADQGQLENIFKQISQETGGSSVQYGEETVIKDIVTPYFTMPTDTNQIKVYTAASKGSTNNWETPVLFSDGKVDIDKNTNTVSVSGFSFKENWCGNHTSSEGTTFHNGKKLIIEFTVSPKDGFLGGNGVPTNGATSGVYHNNQLVGEFPFPTVNVPIQPVTVTAEDKNVYLLGTVTENDCKTGASAMCGDVVLNLNAANYGLESWQTEFVEITTTVTNPTESLTEDANYTINVKVEPKPGSTTADEGTPATAKTGTVEKNINVFKPELTFKDTEAYYGADVPTNFDSNLTATVWKHGTTTDKSVTMIGDEPNLAITYTPDASKIADDKINTTEDIGVAVTVKIGNKDVTTPHTTFKHEKCNGKTCTLPEGYRFLIHVKTCTLTIKKDVKDTAIDDGQSFIFKVTGPMGTKTVVIQGAGSVTLKGLKVGEYTVIEDTGWSWRYKTTDGTQTATLSAATPEGSVTVTNTLKNEKWVSTDVYCKNEFKGNGIQTIINGNGKPVNN